MALYPLLRPLAFAFDAERAHRLTIGALKLKPAGAPARADPMLGVEVAGLAFPNPVGLAAGFDKDAEVYRQMLGFGFGFVEVGTLTPAPQAGNPKPRLFRLAEDRAVINRMGFNNQGQAAALTRLDRGAAARRAGRGQYRRQQGQGGRRGRDRRLCRGRPAMLGVADYLTVNISSPNTPGLRALQDQGALGRVARRGASRRAAPARLCS